MTNTRGNPALSRKPGEGDSLWLGASLLWVECPRLGTELTNPVGPVGVGNESQ